MISTQVFTMGLLLISTLNGLTTEAIKKILDEQNKTYSKNTLSGLVSLVLSIVVSGCYVVMADIEFTSQIVVCMIVLIFTSWLCAMVGYDKVIQTISQINVGKDE